MLQIDWPVLARQIALVLVPLAVSRGILPDYLAGPVTDLAAYVLGTVIVGWVIAIGQRREQPKAKIAAVASLPTVTKVEVKSEALANSIPSRKVVA